MFRSWLELARISNLPTVWTNVTAAWLLGGGLLNDPRWYWLLIAGSLLYTGGMILNDVADIQFDRKHKADRPIPTGRLSAAAASAVGMGMLATGGFSAIVAGEASYRLVLFLILAILFYDWYHKPWPGAVWVMGACRVLLFLMAATVPIPSGTGQGASDPAVLISAIVLGAYIVGVTIVARMEGRGGPASLFQTLFSRGLLYLPGIAAVAWIFSAANLDKVSFASVTGLLPLAPLLIVLAFAVMVTFAMRYMRRGGPAIGNAVGILLAGIPIVDALALSRIHLPLAALFVALAPLLRLWQRYIAAT